MMTRTGDEPMRNVLTSRIAIGTAVLGLTAAVTILSAQGPPPAPAGGLHFEVMLAGGFEREIEPLVALQRGRVVRIGQDPAASVALEDSETGVAAALAAGMTVVGVPSFPGIALDEANLVVPALTDPRVWELLELPIPDERPVP